MWYETWKPTRAHIPRWILSISSNLLYRPSFSSLSLSLCSQRIEYKGWTYSVRQRYQYLAHLPYLATDMLTSIYIAAWLLAHTTPAFAGAAMVGRAPQAEPTSVALGTASGGALDPTATRPPHVGPKPAFAGGPDLTINVVNSYGTPLSIFYGSNAGAPTPVGNPGSGVLTSSTQVLFPSGWAGRITIGRNYDPQGSKIEGSFSPPNYVPDVDISYVDGYSVPISCSCSGVAVAGCNIRMFSPPHPHSLPML